MLKISLLTILVFKNEMQVFVNIGAARPHFVEKADKNGLKYHIIGIEFPALFTQFCRVNEYSA